MLNLIMLCFSSILAMIFTTMNHPLAMGLMLLLQTLMICLITGLISQSYWFSYILFLVFLGGLLVLFIYVTSLASNEMFNLSSSSLIMFSIPFCVAITFVISTDPLPWLNSILNVDISTIPMTMNLHEEASMSLIKLYNQPTGIITLMLVMYLFLTLIAVVSVTKIFQGPLRQKN
uniref:NADH dehydrogenase subunit 6 n=1 Tax=Cryptoperla kawasawai TaxID=1173517 RepID=UPI002176DB14|nr:NADH dehydrogenase subunit 6 [Cryptoperla kawasawai]UUK29382.1 NADH dehydrogenase subunit 6 [Cryptoperla kawasawai]